MGDFEKIDDLGGMMKWIRFKNRRPPERIFIAALRTEYPSAYWVGYYNEGLHSAEDPLTFWHPLEKPPKEYDEATL